jgi:two-component system chemotaxis sensor kinase CheA
MDYSFFDPLIDCVFVLNSERGIVYCNESAAKLCESSVKRLSKGKPLYNFLTLTDQSFFGSASGTKGLDEPAPYEEVEFKMPDGKTGRVQVAIQPFKDVNNENRWVVMMRDVTLEEVLHAKYHKQLEEKEIYINKLEEAQTQLESYSKNLEQMVLERTKEVNQANKMLNAIMNSLGQGFLVFDKSGLCSRFYTRACESILEIVPAEKNITEVLRVEDKEIDTFKLWLEAIFSNKLPFDSMKDLIPVKFVHSQSRHIELDFFPILDDKESVEFVVTVATDKTNEHRANLALEKEKSFAKMIVKMVTSQKHFESFINSVPFTIQHIMNGTISHSGIDVESAFRMLHTLEGEAATYSLHELWLSSRECQEILEPLRKADAKIDEKYKLRILDSVVKIQQTYDDFVKNNTELFNMLGIGKEKSYQVPHKTVQQILSYISKASHQDLVSYVENLLTRESFFTSIQHYDNVIQQVSIKTGKAAAKLQCIGDDLFIRTEDFRYLIAGFVHVFRNAVDHGCEDSGIRVALGKPSALQMSVKAERFKRDNETWFRFQIRDDGRGIDAKIIREKIQDRYSSEALSLMSDFDVIQHIFGSGLSTKSEVTEFSGRGVGMNVVLEEARKLGGIAFVTTELGQWTCVTIEVPDQNRVEYIRASG